jgi:hypothetical protein
MVLGSSSTSHADARLRVMVYASDGLATERVNCLVLANRGNLMAIEKAAAAKYKLVPVLR